MRALLEEQAPDVIGTQEGLPGQLEDLASDLPAYGWVGQGREGGSRGE
jgi:endonuclease/exonuclease/phosphatase family metal-dependent hydrolase